MLCVVDDNGGRVGCCRKPLPLKQGFIRVGCVHLLSQSKLVPPEFQSGLLFVSVATELVNAQVHLFSNNQNIRILQVGCRKAHQHYIALKVFSGSSIPYAFRTGVGTSGIDQ